MDEEHGTDNEKRKLDLDDTQSSYTSGDGNQLQDWS
jgi:hypothetical protein